MVTIEVRVGDPLIQGDVNKITVPGFKTDSPHIIVHRVILHEYDKRLAVLEGGNYPRWMMSHVETGMKLTPPHKCFSNRKDAVDCANDVAHLKWDFDEKSMPYWGEIQELGFAIASAGKETLRYV